jgi:hypothetical protein
MNKFYAGIGSRKTPEPIQTLFSKIAVRMAANDYILRSGGAAGADIAFEAGAGAGKAEIYLPWPKFNNNPSTLCIPSPQAFAIAEKYHPGWKLLTPTVKKLMARNSHQILGEDLKTPSKLVICWTLGGRGQGGTGQALRIAKDYNIPIVDFGAGAVNYNLDKIKEIIQ